MGTLVIGLRRRTEHACNCELNEAEAPPAENRAHCLERLDVEGFLDGDWMPILSKSAMTLAASATLRKRRSSFATTTTALPFLAAARSRHPAGRLASGLSALTPASSKTSAR